MIERILVVTAAVGCGTVGGVMFAFSSFVMPALARLAPEAGAAAMQSINVTAVRPPLMLVLFGTAAVGVAATVVALATRGRAAALVAAGTGIYLVGVIGVTAVVNVPLNDRLAAVAPAEAASSGLWADYLRTWTAANGVRAAAGAVAAALLAASAG